MPPISVSDLGPPCLQWPARACYDGGMVQPNGAGKFRLFSLLDGFFWLDGGPMFGVVPKPLWSRIYTPDERNRIKLAMRPLLLEAQNTWILIDTGIGDKLDEKLNGIYGVERTPRIEDQLAAIGVYLPTSGS